MTTPIDTSTRTAHETAGAEVSEAGSLRSGFAWASVFNLVVKALGIGTGVVAARLLGPQGRGDLAAVMMVISVVALVGSLGVDQAVALEIGRRRARETPAARTGLVLALIAGLIFTALVIAGAPFILPADDVHLVPEVRLIALSLVPLFLGYVVLAVDQGAFRFARRGILASLQPVGYLALMLVAWALDDATVRGFTMAYVVAQGLAMVIRLGVFRRVLFPERAALPEVVPVRTLARSGIRLHLPHLATLAIQKLDMVVVVFVLDSTQTGLYAVAFAIAFGQNALIEAFSRVSFARVAGLDRPAQRTDAIVAHARIAQVVAVGVMLAVMLVTPLVVRYVFGAEFVPAIGAALILVGAWGILGLAMSIDMSLRGDDQIRPGVIAFGLGTAVLIVGGFAVVPGAAIGIEAMATVMVAAAGVALAVLVVALSRLPGVRLADVWGLRPSVLALVLRGTS